MSSTPRIVRAVFCLLCLLCLLCLALPAMAQWATDPLVNNPVCVGYEDQYSVCDVGDGAGGLFVAWMDDRDGQDRVYVQRIDAEGTTVWADGGVRACTYTSIQTSPVIVTDDAGGAIVAWLDTDGSTVNLYAQRFAADGSRIWNNYGMAICEHTADEEKLAVAPDGYGGLLAAWQDDRSGSDSVYAQRLDDSGARLWTANGVLLSAAAGLETAPQVITDTGGGAIVTWDDTRQGTPAHQIYARRINYAGTPIWTANGVPVIDNDIYDHESFATASDGHGGIYVCLEASSTPGAYVIITQYLTATGSKPWSAHGNTTFGWGNPKVYPQAVADGAGGVLVVCYEVIDVEVMMIRCQRFNDTGVYLFGFEGRTATTETGPMYYPKVGADGNGGALVVWTDFRHIDSSCYGQHFDGFGERLWGDTGRAINIGSYMATTGNLVVDEDGGALIAWRDFRLPGDDIFAQRIDGTGYLGDPTPTITAADDFPDDQGGCVEVSWMASYLDAMPWHAVENYGLWMRLGGSKRVVEAADADAMASLKLTPELAADFAKSGWTYVGAVPAMLEASYGLLAPTYGDSTTAVTPITEYMVSAHGDDVWEVWRSDPVGGYSIDDIVPGAPLNLAGDYDGAGNVALTWSGGGTDPDLHHYAVYRDATSGFAPAAANRVGTCSTPSYLDPVGSGRWFYRVTAVDVHDGESAPSDELAVSDATAVADAPTVLALHDAMPNPFNPRTEIRFDLPRDGTVSLSVYALDGRRVKTLVEGPLAAGRHVIAWDGRDDAGRQVASGAYVCLLGADGERRQMKVSLLK